MESQDNRHLPQEHTSQESVPESRENDMLAAPAPAAILKRLRLGRTSLLSEMDETQLLATLESAEWQVRMAAVQKLEEYSERAPIESFVRALKDEHEAVRAAAANALGAIGNPKAIIPLVDALQDVTWLVRSAVIQALGRFGEQAPVEPFTVAIHDEDESVRRTVHFLHEMYPDRFAETIEGIPASISKENSENAFDTQVQIFRPAASNAEQQETYNGNAAASTGPGLPPLFFQAKHEFVKAVKQEDGSNILPTFDDERGQQFAVPYRNLPHYPRRGTVHALRLALLACSSIFLGYLVSVIWNLVQLTNVDLAQLASQVAIQALSVPLTALTELNVPVWIRGVCMLLAFLLFICCLWAVWDIWYEHMWIRSQGVRSEELEVGSGGHDQFTLSPAKSPRQIPATHRFSRRAVLVGLTTVFIVGNSIAWSLLLKSKRRQGSSGGTLGTVLCINRGHTGSVRSVAAWSPDSTRIASGSDGKTVQVWDANNGKHVYTYRGHYHAPLGFITSVAWSPDGTRIATASDDRTVQIWDAANGEHVYIYRGQTAAVTTAGWSPDGAYIASGSEDKTVQVWGAI